MRLALVLVVLAVVTGCGRSGQQEKPLTKEGYQLSIQDVNSGSQLAVQLFGELVTGPRPQAECAAKAQAFQRELERIVAEVEALSPPDDVADLQAELLDAARESVDTVGDAVERVEAGELSCGEELNAEIYGLACTERAERALGGIESKGYVIFGE
jgi:hypothetical protein